MKLLRYYVLVALVIILVYAVLAYRLNREAVAQHEQTFNQNQALQTQLSARSIEDHLGWVMDEFYAAAAYGIPEDTPVVEPAMLSGVADLLATTLQIYPEETLLIGFFTSPGDPLLVFKSPSGLLDDARLALDGWVEANWPLLEAYSGGVVTPFAATPDHQLYGVLLPVSRQGKFLGVLAGTMNFAPVLERYVSPMRSGHYGSAWVQDARGLVIYDHETQIIGQNVFEMNRDYADLQRTFQRMAVQESGQDEYHFLTQRGGTVARKLVAWDTVYLGDQRLTIALAAPSTEINSNLQGYRQFTLLLGLLLGITLVGSGSLFYLTRQRVLERRVAERTQELEALATSLEQRITERTQELELERAQLRTILEAMEDGVIYTEKSVIKYLNPSMCRLTGYSLEDFVRYPSEIYDLMLSPNDPSNVAGLKRRFRTALSQGMFWRENVRVQRKDGRLFEAAVTMALVRNSQGEIVGRADGLRDISHEKALQDQRDLFITNASHELRRPLSNLKARLYLLSRQPERMAEHLSVIQKAADDMADLVQDLVEVAQFSREDIRLDSKSLVVQHALAAALSIQEAPASRKQVTLLAAIPDLPIHVFGDYQRLVQTFGNLISSAVHFSPPGGRVQVRLFTRSNGRGSWAVIQVQDGGPGIPPDQLAFVFDPFFRASEGDASTTGLELTVARHIVELHRGLLTVESDAQVGNTFTLQLSTNLTPLPSER